MSPSAWFANVCLSLAGLIHSFGFETWLVVEHEKVFVFLKVYHYNIKFWFCDGNVMCLCSKVSEMIR